MEQFSIDKIGRELMNLKKEVAEIKLVISESQDFRRELSILEEAGIEDLITWEKEHLKNG